MTALSLMFAPLPALAAPAETDEIADAPEGEDENRQRAIEAYQRGTQLYNEAKFEEALDAFEEAATLYASPDFQFNIGKCYERLGEYEQAIHHYEIYLRTAGDTPDAAVIRASIEDLEKRIAEAEAQAEAEAEAEANKQPPPTEDKPTGKPLIITGGALIGLGVAAGLGGGLAFGLQVARDNNTLGDVLSTNPDNLTFAEAEAIADEARLNQTLEVVMIGVGGAIAVTGIALLAVGLKQKKRSAAPSEASARVQIAPTWTQRGAGLLIRGSF